MSLFARLHTSVLSWWQDTPLPATDASASSIFQSWHEFDEASNQWCPVEPARATTKPQVIRDVAHLDSQSMRLVTWNVDSTSPLAGPRTECHLVTHFLPVSGCRYHIFSGNWSCGDISHILADTRLRQGWFLSETESAIPDGQPFTSITMLSKARFRHPQESSQTITLGPVWRVKYPSRFGRDALCYDIFAPSSITGNTSRIRLINVHLDSLPIQPSLRPQQISIATSFLRSAGRRIVAGDFNPVLSEDTTLVEDHGLADAWAELQPGDPGFTWGIDGKQPFPPDRMDKVAAFGLRLQGMDVHHPGTVDGTAAREQDEGQEQGASGLVVWSDHSGLSCTFELVG